MADAGKIMVTCEGDYDPERLYDRLCLVNSDDGSYLSKKPVQGIKPTEGEFWQKFDIKMATDNEFSETSINPVQNRVITAKINEMDENIGTNAENIETISGEIETLNTDLAKQVDSGFLRSNILNKNLIKSNDGVTVTQKDSGVQVVTKMSAGYLSSDTQLSEIDLKVGKTYTISADIVITSGIARMSIRNASNQVVAGSSSITSSGHYSTTITITSDMAKLSLFATWGTSENGNVTYNNLQIVEGDKDVSYTEYSGMSNRELTEESQNIKDDISSNLQAGRRAISVQENKANKFIEADVTFDKPFTKTPIIVLTVQESSFEYSKYITNIQVKQGSITKQGFTISFLNLSSSSSSWTINWVAVGI